MEEMDSYPSYFVHALLWKVYAKL
ncbi:hypothetical protein NC651_024188 [Populus alba x Populus x berolinensis]|nr:hypothetical protein NC651_024188 [Populus alba x Populus x berolinensis]